MTPSQRNAIATAYRLSKGVLNEIEDTGYASQVLALAGAVGALEVLCLQEHHKANALTDAQRAEFIAAKPQTTSV